MAAENTVDTMNGMAKRVYGEVANALPKYAQLQADIKFRRQDRQGENYNFPVVLTREHGWTFSNSPGSAFNLEEAEAAESKNAQVEGTAGVGRAKLAYGALSRIPANDERAFVNATEHVVTNLRESGAFYIEAMMIYGGRGVAEIESVSGSGTTRTWTIKKSSWATGFWAQMVNAYIDVYDNETLSSKQNGNADVQVTGVDVKNRQIDVKGNSTDLGSVAADEWIVPRGWKTNTFSGIVDILANTGSKFGIDASIYPLWRATEYSNGSAALNLGSVQAALTAAVGQGLMDDVKFCVNPNTFADMNTDHAALRRFAESTATKVEIGTKAISYWGPNGAADIKSHPMVYAGRCFGITPRKWRRIGSSDFSFGLPNYPGHDKFFRELASSAGFELRAWFDQATICRVPAQQIYITDLVNDSL